MSGIRHTTSCQCCTIRCQINVLPCLSIFQFFATSQDFIRSPHLLILRKLTFCTNPSFHFLSFLVLSTPNLHGKIAYCCIHSSFVPNDNLFLFFSPLYNHVKPVLKVRPPVKHLCCISHWWWVSNCCHQWLRTKSQQHS